MTGVYPESVTVEVDLGAGFVELEDLISTTDIAIARGIMGTGPSDRVAGAGTLSFQLDNSEHNAAGLLGYYSPNNANRLEGWETGIPVRCVVTYLSSAEPVFTGTINAIEPSSGKWGPRRVEVVCTDWMDEAARTKVTGIPVQVGQRSDQVLATLVAAVPSQPVATDIGAGGDLYPFALDNAFGEKINLMAELQRLLQSELGFLFVKRDGTLTFQSRFRRPNISDLSETLTDEDILELEPGRGRASIVNEAQITVHPRRVDSSPAVLFSLASNPELARGTAIELRAPYRDPLARATRAGGVDMITPVATTDYTFNTVGDGTGVDITGQLSVVATYGGNEAEVVATNNGPRHGFVTKLQLRGTGIYDYETILATWDSEPSKDKFGERALAVDMPYQGDLVVAGDAAKYLVAQNKSVLTPVTSVSFVANREQRLLEAALEIDIGERVKVVETVIGSEEIVPVGEAVGIAALEFFVQSVELTIGELGIMVCTWGLTPADPYSYWTLDVAGLMELNLTTRLGYGLFVAGWVLGESVLGSTTKLD